MLHSKTSPNESLHVVRLPKLGEMREVALDEIRCAAQPSACQQRIQRSTRIATRLLSLSMRRRNGFVAPAMKFAGPLGEFARSMTEEQGLSPHSVRSHRSKASTFLAWFGKRHRSLARVSVEDLDEFLAMKGAADGIANLFPQPRRRCESFSGMPRHAACVWDRRRWRNNPDLLSFLVQP
jgi:hypothetical protein